MTEPTEAIKCPKCGAILTKKVNSGQPAEMGEVELPSKSEKRDMSAPLVYRCQRCEHEWKPE